MQHDEDPRKAILDKVGDLSGVEVFGSDVLVGIYMRPTKTKSGIILADTTVDEDRWQSKAALVLKLGNTAFKDENNESFRDIAPGDWVVIRPSDGFPVQLSSVSATSSREAVPCRIVTDIHIRARVTHPDTLY
jgi:co-chaperonin GroES (HSP10)